MIQANPPSPTPSSQGLRLPLCPDPKGSSLSLCSGTDRSCPEGWFVVRKEAAGLGEAAGGGGLQSKLLSHRQLCQRVYLPGC